MKFELGKAYRRRDGIEMKIIGIAQTSRFGVRFVGECLVQARLELQHYPVTKFNNANGWEEIPLKEWEENFK